ncbi:hypothetical protein [Nocardia sp. NBC_00403]|uniref:hypothetical protein n=1 Tax=Nocardia sp. NBC_00403 TaxID=2975990 RepID=UPI002E1C17EF
MHALTTAGCQRIFTDKKSGKDAERVTRVLSGPRDQAIVLRRYYRTPSTCRARLAMPNPLRMGPVPTARRRCRRPYCRAMCMRISLWMSVISSPERSTVTVCSVPVNRAGGS